MVLTKSGSKVDEITFFADRALPGRFGPPNTSSRAPAARADTRRHGPG
jgi:hypothetical protein